jgi:hypothetical protein
VVESFEEKHGLSPLEVSETDPRWISHQRSYFNAFMMKVHDLMVEEELSGRKLELVLEGQGTSSGGLESEPGWSRVPGWVKTPDFIDWDTIVANNLVDGISLWTFRGIEELVEYTRNNVDIATRYRYMEDVFTKTDYHTRITEAEARGVSLFVINEPRVPLGRFEWLYPGELGPIFEIANG